MSNKYPPAHRRVSPWPTTEEIVEAAGQAGREAGRRSFERTGGTKDALDTIAADAEKRGYLRGLEAGAMLGLHYPECSCDWCYRVRKAVEHLKKIEESAA